MAVGDGVGGVASLTMGLRQPGVDQPLQGTSGGHRIQRGELLAHARVVPCAAVAHGDEDGSLLAREVEPLGDGAEPSQIVLADQGVAGDDDAELDARIDEPGRTQTASRRA